MGSNQSGELTSPVTQYVIVQCEAGNDANLRPHELCRVMGLAGKPQGMDGGNVETYQRDDRIKEIAQYCDSDVINAYRVWLRYELFLGKLNPQFYEVRELISAALRPALALSPLIAMWVAAIPVGAERIMLPAQRPLPRFLTVFFSLYAQPDPAENERGERSE